MMVALDPWRGGLSAASACIRARPTLSIALFALLSSCAPGRVALPTQDDDTPRTTTSLAHSVQALVDAGISNRERERALLVRATQLGLRPQQEAIDWWSPHGNVVIEIAGAGAPRGDLVYVVAHYDKTSITPLAVPALLTNGALDEIASIASVSDGATDNATGVAIALELARALALDPPTHDTRILLAGQEEMGLRGSRAHVAGLDGETWQRLRYVINVDTIGVRETQRCIMTDVSAPFLVEAAHASARELGVALGEGTIPVGALSDHAPFREWSACHDVGAGLLLNLCGGLVPQRSWFQRPHRAHTIFFSTCELLDLGDVAASLTLLPFGNLHGFRDRAEAVDVASLHDGYRTIERMIRKLDGARRVR